MGEMAKNKIKGGKIDEYCILYFCLNVCNLYHSQYRRLCQMVLECSFVCTKENMEFNRKYF